EGEFSSLRNIYASTNLCGRLQVVWSVVLSNGAPFLISLGLAKSLTPLVWLAAPLCGLIVQPVIGVYSDHCQSRWGRRRPFAIVGTIATVTAIIALSRSKELAQTFSDCFGTCSSLPPRSVENLAIVIAVVFVYCLNIAVATVQVALRAMIVDNCPARQQARVNAWASYMAGGGNIFGYIAGSVSLVDWFRLPNTSQFQFLCLLASAALMVSISWTCWRLEEKILFQSPHMGSTKSGESMIHYLRSTWTRVPRKIRQVLHVQFWSWMGWFPFLYYSTTYIAELYTESIYKAAPSVNPEAGNLIRKKATYLGTFGSLNFAVVSLLTNLVLSHVIGRVIDLLQSKEQWTLIMSRLWAASQILLAILMINTQWVTTSTGGTTVVAVAGISWAFTVWTPYAIIGTELAE
ncbi:hypothetical protein DM02DRAFT_471251, partial [Periconia macrospinosa]